jgi:hypothetical protein
MVSLFDNKISYDYPFLKGGSINNHNFMHDRINLRSYKKQKNSKKSFYLV